MFRLFAPCVFWLALIPSVSQRAHSQSFGGDMKSSVAPLDPRSGAIFAVDRTIGNAIRSGAGGRGQHSPLPGTIG
jgi:hypothetical protein